MSELQKRILDIYKVFKEICDKHGLRYFAEGGTAIGAVRHGGFIPWDDDLDVVMPMPDIHKLLKIFPKEAPKHLGVFWFTIEGRVLKIHDKKTTFIEWAVLDKPADYEGVFIDIFPLIGLPDGKTEADRFAQEVGSVYGDEYIKYLSDKQAKKHVPHYMSLCNLYNYDSANYVGRTVFRYVLQKASFDKPTVYKFEDTEIYLPGDISSFLARFGDYMKLPPEDQRSGHHEVQSIVDLTKPFKYYEKELVRAGGWLTDSIAQNTRICSIYQMNEFQKDITNLRADIADLKSQNRILSESYESVVSSSSWKLTKPLRVIRSWFTQLSVAKRNSNEKQ